MSDDLRQYAPTARRLAQLRQAGIFPYSSVLTAAAVLAVVLLLIAGFSQLLLGALERLLTASLGGASAADPAAVLGTAPVVSVGLLTGALLLVIWLVAAGIAALQRWGAPGGETAGAVLFAQPKVSLRRSRTADLAWELVVSAVIVLGGAMIIYGRLPLLMQMSATEPDTLVRQLQQVIGAFAWRFGLMMVGLGLCDYLYQRAIFSYGAAMTRQELREEIRETEAPWLVRWWRQRREKIRR